MKNDNFIHARNIHKYIIVQILPTHKDTYNFIHKTGLCHLKYFCNHAIIPQSQANNPGYIICCDFKRYAQFKFSFGYIWHWCFAEALMQQVWKWYSVLSVSLSFHVCIVAIKNHFDSYPPCNGGIYVSACPSVHLSVCRSVCLSGCSDAPYLLNTWADAITTWYGKRTNIGYVQRGIDFDAGPKNFHICQNFPLAGT